MSGTINDRIEIIINERFSGNKSAFAKSIDMAPTGMSSYISKQRRSKPNVDMIAKIVKKLGVDARWLLTGEGSLNEKNTITTTATDHSAAAVNGNAVTINNSTEVDRKLIEKLMSENELLNRLLDEKERFINHLLNKGTSE